MIGAVFGKTEFDQWSRSRAERHPNG
jgi:hypothetical protein